MTAPKRAESAAPIFHVVSRTPVIFAVVRCGCGCGGTAAQLQFADGRCLGVSPHRTKGAKPSTRRVVDAATLQQFGRYGREALRLVAAVLGEVREIQAGAKR